MGKMCVTCIEENCMYLKLNLKYTPELQDKHRRAWREFIHKRYFLAPL